MSAVPCWARSAGTSAVHSADSTTASSSPATTSYQYHPPSTNGVRVRSKAKVSRSPSTVAASTRWERPLAIDLYTVTLAPRPATVTLSRTSSTTLQRRQYDAGNALK